MNPLYFFNIIKNPQSINEQDTIALQKLIKKYPYFQSARALYLKGLKNEESFAYNTELKLTAAYTTDRSILFDYITSDYFNQNTISVAQQKLQDEVNNIEVVAPEEISTFETETSVFDAEVLNPELFEVKKEGNLLEENPKNLNLGKPLEFDISETHSFNEWLKISAISPIVRNENIKPIENSNSKFDLIDKFIAKNPKIKPVKKVVSLKNLAKENNFNSDELMTETLAKVYLEQKNYKKAKQAYRILSLKYPEKSSFFADRIAEIKKIEINNTK